MPLNDGEAEALAARILDTTSAGLQIAPITQDDPDFGLEDAYRVSAHVTARRIARGEHRLGWKIGFTNTTIWDEYGVHAPIWGPMYDSTLRHLEAGSQVEWPLAGLLEPRIEPEIALRIGAEPHPSMTDLELLACVDCLAHGVEVVQSLFPGWRFKAADTIAAFALHGGYRCGPLVPLLPDDVPAWMDRLARFEITLHRNGEAIDRGMAANVMGGGPLAALRCLVDGLEADPMRRRLQPGDLITTGTVTRAFPVHPGETWETRIDGLPLPGLRIAFG